MRLEAPDVPTIIGPQLVVSVAVSEWDTRPCPQEVHASSYPSNDRSGGPGCPGEGVKHKVVAGIELVAARQRADGEQRGEDLARTSQLR
jgi:hypothetical protein